VDLILTVSMFAGIAAVTCISVILLAVALGKT
jgi:hypothetical protein